MAKSKPAAPKPRPAKPAKATASSNGHGDFDGRRQTLPKIPRPPKAVSPDHLRRVAALIPEGVVVVHAAPARPASTDPVDAAHALTVDAIAAYELAAEEIERVARDRAEHRRRNLGLQGGQAAADREELLWDRITGHATYRLFRACDHLAAIIRTWDDILGTGNLKDEDRDPYPNRGYIHNGKLYLSIVKEDGMAAREECDREFHPRDHELRVVDLREIVEGGPAEVDEGGAEKDRRARPTGTAAAPAPMNSPGPFPLARCTLTLANPADTHYGDPQPTSVEIIVIANDVHTNDVTASEDDLPELKAAGWHSFMTGTVDVFLRVLF